ncbi:MAG: gliding motility-associated protein GldE [Bacteroidales bacterium]|nr:gliding motility-associated protein GldE [Bacteroidales bacterium]
MEDPLSQIFLSTILVNAFTPQLFVGVFVLILMLALSAFVSGSEVAYFALKPQQLEQLKNEKSKKNEVVLRLHALPEKLLATILIVNNLVNVGIVILSSFLSNSIFDFSHHPTLGFIVQVVVITFILLLFGEIIPKVYASRYAVGFAMLTANGIQFLMYIFHPLSIVLMSTSNIIKHKLRKKKQQVSIDELSDALDLTDEQEMMDDKILKGIVNFSNIGASEIMRSRMDVITVNIGDTFTKVVEVIRQSGYSRIPVIDETFDQIKGILYIKDLLPHAQKSQTFKWQSMIRPPFFVPESKKIDDLLKDFQTKKIHMAVVVDEYGGSSGIVTLEDVLEEIIGEINDEFDNIEQLCIKISDAQYQFEGKTLLIDFCKKYDIAEDYFDNDKGDAETLAGFILEIKGEIPEKNETFTYKAFKFDIKAVDHRRIKQIIVTYDAEFKED